ncbi:MAG: hypothetical protein N2645_23055 [Clostridia bacterium]|nr:hypothetical protein [Clostridia bacterium]
MKIKVSVKDNESIALIWLTKTDLEKEEVQTIIDEYHHQYNEVVIYRSGTKPLKSTIKQILQYQKLKDMKD